MSIPPVKYVFTREAPLPGTVNIAKATVPYVEWNEDDRVSSFAHQRGLATKHDHYLVYGKIGKGSPLEWSFIPFEQRDSTFWRYCQQLSVLRALTFGGMATGGSIDNLRPDHTDPSSDTEVSNDHFCNPAVIERQLISKGETVNLLCDHKPLGNEHFLIIPKEHRKTFRDVTQAEYLETTSLLQQIAACYKNNTIYIMHKTGREAGQSVPHWHMHVIVITDDFHEIGGRIAVFVKMTFPFLFSPLSDDTLKQRIATLQKALFPEKEKQA